MFQCTTQRMLALTHTHTSSSTHARTRRPPVRTRTHTHTHTRARARRRSVHPYDYHGHRAVASRRPCSAALPAFGGELRTQRTAQMAMSYNVQSQLEMLAGTYAPTQVAAHACALVQHRLRVRATAAAAAAAAAEEPLSQRRHCGGVSTRGNPTSAARARRMRAWLPFLSSASSPRMQSYGVEWNAQARSRPSHALKPDLSPSRPAPAFPHASAQRATYSIRHARPQLGSGSCRLRSVQPCRRTRTDAHRSARHCSVRRWAQAGSWAWHPPSAPDLRYSQVP